MDNIVRWAYFDMMAAKLTYHRDTKGYLRLACGNRSITYNGSWLDRYFI